ncbi:MAG: tRNA (N6-isopentenyl adenosine(37)-C2)-methylthiotransferase MiaB [Coriobacteriia bacterium]|nr:tRNA (N6-isopentenyl adenosine(37)-C2)-methylthiotransferase MiaB [Coriobacteriia bacterium]
MKTYHLKTFGCQMNKHDSERIAGMLDMHGWQATTEPHEADAIIFMTCCVREKAEERLQGQVASLKALNRPLIAVGGCIGQRDGEKLRAQLPHVDVVFGTHNVARLPLLLERARETARAQVEVLDDTVEDFAADLPATPEHAFHAWLPITVGCDNHCTYCIVPTVRGREKSRPFERIIEQAENLVADGVCEITLLGQNVNSYGRDRYGAPRFAELLTAVAATGISRLGFATSHPKDLSDETIQAMASSSALLDYLHLPVQSGSTRILTAMNRRYTKDEYLALVARIREAMPTIALTTDIIVGFPGETDADFADTLNVVRTAQFAGAFTFLYSPREGTPAAAMDGQVPADLAQERFDLLVEEVQRSARAFSETLVGTRASVLIEGASKRDAGILVGKDRHYRTVHVPVPPQSTANVWEGREVEVDVDAASTWYVSGKIVTR